MKQLMENFRLFLNEVESVEKSDSYAKIYKDLNLPKYLGNAAIGAAGFRNGEFIEHYTAEYVLSKKIESSINEDGRHGSAVGTRNLKLLRKAAYEIEEKTGQKVIAAVISPSICLPGEINCVNGSCEQGLNELFGAGEKTGKCQEDSVGRGLVNHMVPGNFIWFFLCNGLGGKSKMEPLGTLHTLHLAGNVKSGKLRFIDAGAMEGGAWSDTIAALKKEMFVKKAASAKKSYADAAKLLYAYSPYGRAENRCKKIFQPGLAPAPFGLIDQRDEFGFGDDRVWNFKCVDKNNVILTNAKDIMSRIGKKGFAYTKELPKCDQKQKVCAPPGKKEA